MTCMLVYCSLMCGLDTPAACGSFTPLVVGSTMMACGGSGGQYTGAVLNPARVLAPIVAFGCGADMAPYYLAGQFAAALISACIVASSARTGPLNPTVSKLALGLNGWEAWRLWITGNPPSRLKVGCTETVETIHDYHWQIWQYYDGEMPKMINRRSTDDDLHMLFGPSASAAVRSHARSSGQLGEDEAVKDLNLMLQHPGITNRESQPDTSPMDISR